MRQPTDYCLLCNSEHSDKKNSHIFPKFLSTKFLGKKEAKRGFQISSDKPISKSKRTVQDSPKEDYLLCGVCEKYFGVLERLSSTFFNDWRENLNEPDYNLQRFTKDFSLLQYRNPNSIGFKLLIYSIFWRASISSNPLFNNIEIDKPFENKLRETLLRFRTNRQNELLEFIEASSEFEVFPFSIITAESFKDATSNILHVPYYNGAYRLIIDQYAFLLFRDEQEIPEELFVWGGNLKTNDCKLLVFSKELWHDTIIQPAFDLLAKSIQNASKSR